ncbi:MAG TPA: formyltransferase family protein [Polyangiaceae bacterium]|jgi:methionyl-tRNA formyltransferase|nr:formyltransferase family protein [Polyangiaceae bacterium]
MPLAHETSQAHVYSLLEAGAAYLDVRTAEEFGAGHVPGAFNVPWQHGSLAGLVTNPDFSASIRCALAVDRTIVVGCHSGGRARAAAAKLRALGYGKVVVHREGWDGSRDDFGRRTPGWSRSEMPIETNGPLERSYAALERRAPSSPLKIAYFGLPLGACLLARDGHQLSFAALSPVPAPGRRRLRRNVSCEILDPKSGAAEFEERVEAAFERERPELLVSWFWTRRLPAKWLRLVKEGFGVHPSLLPRHRGPNPYYWAIDSGDLETGVSVHRLTPRYDDGEVLARQSLTIAQRNAWQLARALDRPGLALLRKTTWEFAAGKPPLGQPQDETLATWAPEPDESDVTEWNWSAQRVLRRIAALAPVPGLHLEIEGLDLFVVAATPARESMATLEPGQAAVWGEPRQLLLRVGDGAIHITRATLLDGREDGTPYKGEQLAERVEQHLESLR